MTVVKVMQKENKHKKLSITDGAKTVELLTAQLSVWHITTLKWNLLASKYVESTVMSAKFKVIKGENGT